MAVIVFLLQSLLFGFYTRIGQFLRGTNRVLNIIGVTLVRERSHVQECCYGLQKVDFEEWRWLVRLGLSLASCRALLLTVLNEPWVTLDKCSVTCYKKGQLSGTGH